MLATLVAPELSREKLRRELELWKKHSPHTSRGWLLLRYDEENLIVEIGFLGKLAITASVAPLPVVVCAIRLTYDNYDLWAPSLSFIDVFTREPTLPPVRAYQTTESGPRDVLINTHPETKRPFLCIPGVREYHSHPQHSGDDWLLHRGMNEGSLTTICERIWQFMVRTVVGLSVEVQAMPMWPLQAQISISLGQGDTDRLLAAAAQPTNDQAGGLRVAPQSDGVVPPEAASTLDHVA